MKRMALVSVLAILVFSCSGQSQYPPPAQSERSQTIPEMPQEVRDAHKNVIAITFKLSVTKSLAGVIFGGGSITSEAGATGLMIKPGVFISARHLILEDIFYLNRLGLPFVTNSASGIPRSKDNSYTYSFIATTNVDGDSKDFPVELVAMPGLGEAKDYIVFQAKNYPKNLKPLATAELKEGENIYAGGYIPYSSHVPTPIGTLIPVLADMIKEVFPGQVYEVINDMPVNKLGAKRLYRIRGSLEFGYSGGPILNARGQVGAITLETARNFIWAISIGEIEEFVKEMERKGVIK